MNFLKNFENYNTKILYHGSKYLFEEFNFDKITTGQSSQDFGWGFYFTNKKEVAEYYTNMLSNIVRQEGKINRYGYLYTIKTNGNFVNYNNNVSEDLLFKINKKLNIELKEAPFGIIYQEVSNILKSKKDTSLFFVEMGVDGIYYHISSRSLSTNLDFKDELNYVIFNVKKIEIINIERKNYEGLLKINLHNNI